MSLPFSFNWWMVISSLQSKHKSNSKRGKSQSSCDDVVLPSFICAFFCLLPFFFGAVYICILWCFATCFSFPFVGGGTSLVGLGWKKWWQFPLLFPQAWKISPLVVMWPRKLGSQWRMSSLFCFLFPQLLKTLKLLSLLFPKIPRSCRLSVLPKLCHLSPWLSLR